MLLALQRQVLIHCGKGHLKGSVVATVVLYSDPHETGNCVSFNKVTSQVDSEGKQMHFIAAHGRK